jgi:hypothetical protein
VIRLIIPYLALLLSDVAVYSVQAKETNNPDLSFSIYLWPLQKSPEPKKLIVGKHDPIPYAAEIQYHEGEDKHSVKLLPGRQTKKLHYRGETPLILYRYTAETNSTATYATFALEPQWRDVLFILKYPDYKSRSYKNFAVDRTITSKTPGTGIVFNLSNQSAQISINGRNDILPDKQNRAFRMQRSGQDFTRFQISVRSTRSENKWVTAHSSKRFLSKKPGTVFLLGSGSSRNNVKVITLSPSR